jgi:hypothetical protein
VAFPKVFVSAGRKTGFYEKVIKVKADVAAVLVSATQRFGGVAVDTVKGAVFWRSS